MYKHYHTKQFPAPQFQTGYVSSALACTCLWCMHPAMGQTRKPLVMRRREKYSISQTCSHFYNNKSPQLKPRTKMQSPTIWTLL